MPIGVTPREDELALIESLARNQVGSFERKNEQYNRDIA